MLSSKWNRLIPFLFNPVIRSFEKRKLVPTLLIRLTYTKIEAFLKKGPLGFSNTHLVNICVFFHFSVSSTQLEKNVHVSLSDNWSMRIEEVLAEIRRLDA